TSRDLRHIRPRCWRVPFGLRARRSAHPALRSRSAWPPRAGRRARSVPRHDRVAGAQPRAHWPRGPVLVADARGPRALSEALGNEPHLAQAQGVPGREAAHAPLRIWRRWLAVLDRRELDGYAALFVDRGIATTTDRAIALLAGSALGGGTIVNWNTSLRIPAAVQEEWRAAGIDDLAPHYDAVAARIDVDTDESER